MQYIILSYGYHIVKHLYDRIIEKKEAFLESLLS